MDYDLRRGPTGGFWQVRKTEYCAPQESTMMVLAVGQLGSQYERPR